jgi:hypothetical protein
VDIYDITYERRRNAPLWWYNKSSDLHASAGALWLTMGDEVDRVAAQKLGIGSGFSMGIACWPVYQMLCGLSLELIFKAIVVAEGKEPSHVHLLTDLASEAGLSYTAQELQVLKLLTESIIWDGRYPVPKNKIHLEKHYQHASEVLYDSIQLDTITVQRPNDSLSWENHTSMWKKGADKFFLLQKLKLA